MSVLTLQVGQCGNQLGQALFTRLAGEYTGLERGIVDELPEEYFREVLDSNGRSRGCVARCLLVDMEPKAVEDIRTAARKQGVFSYRKPTLTKQEGSANNWAFGYQVQAVCCAGRIEEDIRSEVEKMDALTGVHLVHAVAGGTGSGVGSHILEAVREHHPRVPIATLSVLPLDSGEIATQHYNSVLTLSHVQRLADVAVVVDNTEAVGRCRKKRGKDERIRFAEVNADIAKDVCNGVLLPAKWVGGPRLRLLNDFARSTAPDPTRKLVCLRSAEEGNEAARWNVMLKDLSRRCPDTVGNPCVLTFRGQAALPTGGLAHIDVADPSNLFGPLCRVARTIPCPDAAGAATLAFNSPGAARSKLSFLAARVREMLSCRAYLHHFQKYGLEEEDCEAAVVTAEQVVKDYSR